MCPEERVEDILTLQTFRSLVEESSEPLCFAQILSGRDAHASAHFYMLSSWEEQRRVNGMIDAYTRQPVRDIKRFYLGDSQGHLWRTGRAAVLECEILKVLRSEERSSSEIYLSELRSLASKDELFQLAEVESWVASQSASQFFFNYSSQPEEVSDVESPAMEHQWSHPALVQLERDFFFNIRCSC